ncbi:hypothetical protein [Mesohalobacter halotolerans]|uniref:Uncharacterized protein n=1 Tax=Mesohalobacter halotolerans TaxID=1883405 RepID=A0A4U5TQ19_9FLAO|nr:hypothetical protein [Mesohalobacter halotolerans]MBS3738076.1 hypothetical protein [Psychroflexus sp.]TKS56106.1 hypothetical protein FCN74_08800 [Mesohalobacter halotolerans]
MYNIILIFAIGVMSQNEILSNTNDTETKDLKEWVYWNAFSQTFNKTADYWQAESAALEAEDNASDVVEAEEWLAEIEGVKKEKHNKKFHF